MIGRKLNNDMLFSLPPADFKPKFSIAFCICEVGNEILVLQRQDGKGQANEWGVPAGKLNPGETAIVAAQRELFEETGIHLETSRFIFLTTVYDRFPTFDFTVNMFVVKLDTKPPIVLRTEEHKDYIWTTPKDLLSMKHMEDVDQLLKIYFKKL